MNSRSILKTTSRTKPRGFEITYKPGFVDDKDLESVKMAVDKELSSISNAFYQISETIALVQKDYKDPIGIIEGLISDLTSEINSLKERVSALENKP